MFGVWAQFQDTVLDNLNCGKLPSTSACCKHVTGSQGTIESFTVTGQKNSVL